MSVCTQSIGRDEPLAAAQKVMREHQIRHLPVLDDGVLVGVVTDRDLGQAETRADVDDRAPIERAMTREPYFVAPTDAIRDVAEHMVEHRYGCAVVMDGMNVVGIFTTTDALRALISLLDDADSYSERSRAHA